MKRTIIAVLASVLLLSPSIMQAEEHTDPGMATNQPPSQWGYSASLLLMSQYYGTIFGGIFYNGPMSFTDVVASRQNKHNSLMSDSLTLSSMTFDLSIGQKLDRLNKYNADGGNEYDFTIDQSFKFGPKSYEILGDAGVCYLALHDLRNVNDDAFEEFVRLDFPIVIGTNSPVAQPYVEAFHYHDSGTFHNEGWWTYGGVFRDQPLGCSLFGNELKLNIDFRTGASAGAYGNKTGVEYFRLAFALPVTKGKWTVSPSLILQTPNGPDRSVVHKDGVYGTLLIKRSF